ncbi:MAG: hypothetical protein WCG15_02930, partial [Actinomycetes bacterium]
ITPREAEILKAAGGSGTTNPDTGLLEFYDDFEAMPSSQAEFAQYQQAAQPAPSYDTGGFEPQIQSQYDAAKTAEASSGGGLRATPAAFTEAVPSAQPLRFGAGEGIQAATPSTFGPSVPPSLGLGYGVTDTVTPSAALETTSRPPEKSGFLDKMSTTDMIRLGLAGGLGIYGATQAKRGAQQAQQAAGEQKAVGAPYQAKGQELIRAAESGELTPTSQASLQALQARLAQGAESRGGVGAAQVAAQAEAYRQQLLSQQYNLGLQVSNIGDQIALGAIRTGLQADQALNQASTNFYTNLAAIGAGIPMARRD